MRPLTRTQAAEASERKHAAYWLIAEIDRRWWSDRLVGSVRDSPATDVLHTKIHVLFISLSAALVLLLPTTIFGQLSGGTAAEAQAMLLKAVSAVKADKAKALSMFNKGEGGFRDCDLYVICMNIGNNKFVAIGNPNAKYLLGKDVRTFKDIDGDRMGIVAAARKPEGEITPTDYEFPKPGADKTPVPKQTYFSKVEDLVCGVGYYYFYAP